MPDINLRITDYSQTIIQAAIALQRVNEERIVHVGVIPFLLASSILDNALQSS